MPNSMHFDKRLTTLERFAYSESHNAIVVLLYPGEDDATKAAKIATEWRELGLAEDDPRQVVVVRFGGPDGQPATPALN